MIFYAIRETFEGYKIKTPEQIAESMRTFVIGTVEKERGNAIYEWGV